MNKLFLRLRTHGEEFFYREFYYTTKENGRIELEIDTTIYLSDAKGFDADENLALLLDLLNDKYSDNGAGDIVSESHKNI